MYTINTKKFQNTPRGENGKAVEGTKRLRLPDTAFEDTSIVGRTRVLHPTKGWRSRNACIVGTHGTIIQNLDFLHEQAVYRMLIAREERKKQSAKQV